MKSISRNPNPLIRRLVEQATLALGGQGAHGGLERVWPGPGAGERAEQARRWAPAARGITPRRRCLRGPLPQTRNGGSLLSRS
jgi:hypothetical protein